MEYQRIGAWRQVPAASTDFFFGRGSGTRPECFRWVVFGTLLGPEATGPGFPGAGLFLVSWLHRSCAFRAFAGRVCGVCGTGLLFENYIVDASIFYKKQFPRI